MRMTRHDDIVMAFLNKEKVELLLKWIFTRGLLKESYGNCKGRGHALYVQDIKSEVLLKSDKYIVGFIDLEIDCVVMCYNSPDFLEHEFKIFVEVKPNLENERFGEVLRQIRKYQGYTDKGKWLIFTEEETPPELSSKYRTQGIEILSNAKFFLEESIQSNMRKQMYP